MKFGEHKIAIRTSLTLSSKDLKSNFILFQKSKYLSNSPSLRGLRNALIINFSITSFAYS